MTTTKITLSSLLKNKKFDYVSPDITVENFPEPKEIGTDFKLFRFDRCISSEDVIKEMEKENYRPANLYELLSFDWNGKDFVVALGSVCEVGGAVGGAVGGVGELQKVCLLSIEIVKGV